MKSDESAQSPRSVAQVLLPRRRDLVLAAEKVVTDRFQRGRLEKPQKSQFSNLIGVCGEAGCAEEIANYLRYQAGRREWEKDFMNAVLKGIEPILAALPDDDAARVGAWKLYATYLTRAYVYHSAAGSPEGRS